MAAGGSDSVAAYTVFEAQAWKASWATDCQIARQRFGSKNQAPNTTQELAALIS